MPLSVSQQKRLLSHYFFASYLVVLLIVSESVAFSEARSGGLSALLFMAAALLCYGVIYLLPAWLLTGIVRKLVHWKFAPDGLARELPVSLTAIVTTAITSLLLFANAKLYSLYGMFFNGFIYNLLTTPGGIESLGGSQASTLGFVVIALGFLLGQAALFWLVRLAYQRWHGKSLLPRHFYRIQLAAFPVIAIFVHADFAVDAYSTNRLAPLAETVPFFQPVSATHLLRSLGVKATRDRNLSVKGKLNYPLQPLQVQAPAKPYNIIWLAAESWRADTLDSEIMPATWQFAANAGRFTQNYSGGNGTRMGIFTMFTGIPGNYWFPFLRERRGAAIIDVLQQQHYQISLYTSARFSYPEFDKTIFSQVPSNELHWIEASQTGWEKDRENVDNLLDFIDKRDPNKPFFTFMFFESPHARYYFPPESVIRKPYEDDINYATLDRTVLSKNIVGIKNRYINSVHHLDSQFGRIFDYLKAHQLLDHTIVVLLGDHGEEFMEHGFWGHNSTFVDQQVRTPLVVWVPGMQPLVSDQMTSHMDVIPTLLPRLGVTNPASDYATGYDLLGKEKRSYTYISDWDKVTYVDDEVKITQPVNIKSFGGMKASLKDDTPLSTAQASQWLQKKQEALKGLIFDLGKFLANRGSAQAAAKPAS